MKKYICILAGAALLVACEQKTETVAPAASPSETTENNTTVVNPPATTTESTVNNTTVTTNAGRIDSHVNHESGGARGTTTESTTTEAASPTPLSR
jgi:PBP1b-binding outer membrane lipoprotein LpoB